MSFSRKLKRREKLRVLDKRIDELLGMLNLSKSAWKRQGVRVEGTGFECRIAQTRFNVRDKIKWGRHIKGHKPSKTEQFSVLYDLYLAKMDNEKLLEELKQRIDSQKEVENGSE